MEIEKLAEMTDEEISTWLRTKSQDFTDGFVQGGKFGVKLSQQMVHSIFKEDSNG